MKELTLDTMLAVFEEIFGRTLFWSLVAAAAVITPASCKRCFTGGGS